MRRAATQSPAVLRAHDLPVLLEPDRLLELLNESGLRLNAAAPTYIRLKPGAGALVGVELTGLTASDDPVSWRGYIRTHARKRAAILAHKWADRARKHGSDTSLGPGVRLLASGRSVLFLFPNDVRLRALQHVVDCGKLRRAVRQLPALQLAGHRIQRRRTQLEIVRYKPERRLVLGASLRLKDDASGASRRAAIFLRCYPDARGQRLDGHLKHLEHEPVGEHMPRPLGALFAGQVRVEGAVDGQPLRHVLASGEVDGATVAESLSLLHASRPPPGATPPLSRPLETALDAAGVLASLGIERARELGSALRAATLHALEPSLIHGDFQLDQVIVTRDGRAVLVDFDRLALGSPLADLGRMRADLQIASARSSEAASTLELAFTEDFVASYAECRPGVSLDLPAIPDRMRTHGASVAAVPNPGAGLGRAQLRDHRARARGAPPGIVRRADDPPRPLPRADLSTLPLGNPTSIVASLGDVLPTLRPPLARLGQRSRRPDRVRPLRAR